jgi:mRNA interferase MazF
LLGKLPGEYDDWLICMISSQIRRSVPEFDEIIREGDPDFCRKRLESIQRHSDWPSCGG